MRFEFARARLRDIDAAVAALTKTIADGSAQDFETYRSLTGERRGLLRARDMIVDALDKDEREELRA